MSNSAGGPWKEVGKSTHPLLITYKLPFIGLYGSGNSFSDAMPYYSCLYWACKRARHFSNESEIIDGIFTEFQDKIVTRVLNPNVPLYYYYEAENILNQPQCYDTKNLLNIGVGRCGAWARFFSDMLRLQGISTAEIKGLVWELDTKLNSNETAKLTGRMMTFFGAESSKFVSLGSPGWYAAFHVKNWRQDLLVENNFTFYHEDPGILQFEFPLMNGNLISPNGNLWGLSGQGPNNEPPGFFFDHAIVKYGNKIYDPSYGTKFENLSDWESSSVDAFGTVGIWNEPLFQPRPLVTWFSYINTPSDGQTLIKFAN
jgi:hypothetical protein